MLNSHIAIPYFAIGGITRENVRGVVNAGARRVAVCNGVFGTKDIFSVTAFIKRELVSP